jgi:glycosyltransferase involved in cell wall biosynthesis
VRERRSYAGNNMKLLWFNWRDLKNPEAGGAEVLTHEIASRLIQKGTHQITLFTSHFQGALSHENIDGLDVIREGGKYSVYSKAKRYYKKYKQNYDIVIDEINVKPFLTPKYVKDEKPILALIHQISPEQFLLELPFPLNYIGYYFEKKWLSCYKDILTVTVSNSTKRDLEQLGFQKVSIIPVGLSIDTLESVPEKESIPTITFIGRLKKHKLPHHAMIAFSLVKKRIPDARLWVIGDGYMRKDLERKYKVNDVTFYGHVSSQVKYELLSRSHIVIVPATREGWGLVVTESNAMGTPVVAYNVPGLRDSVRNGYTGILVQEDSPRGLASAIISLLENRHTLDNLSSNALSFSREFNWDTTAAVFNRIITENFNGRC